MARPAAQASAALLPSNILTNLPSREPACGRDYLALLMREVHGLPWSPEEAIAGAGRVRRAWRAHRSPPARGAAPLPMIRPADLPAACRHWHDRALAPPRASSRRRRTTACPSSTAPEWAAARQETCTSCPTAARQPSHRYRQRLLDCCRGTACGSGQADPCCPSRLYRPPYAERPRPRAPSRLARLAGTDCASGIAWLPARWLRAGPAMRLN